MKRFLFVAIAIIAMASCSDKSQKAASKETPIEGTSYVLTQAPSGKFGVQKDGKQIIEEKYDSLYYFHGCFVGTSTMSDFQLTSLITPDGREGISGSQFRYEKEGNYFATIGQPTTSIFFADTGKGFGALNKYAVADNVVLIKRQKLGAYTTANDTLLAENADYQKLVYLKKDKKFLVQIEGKWFKTANDTDKASPVAPAELKKYQKQSGWKNDDLFVLE